VCLSQSLAITLKSAYHRRRRRVPIAVASISPRRRAGVAGSIPAQWHAPADDIGALIEHVLTPAAVGDKSCWEPAPGEGHMSEVQASTTVSCTIGAVFRGNSRNGSSFNIARSISSRAAAG